MSLRAFNDGLYLEHADEVSALTERRAGWLADRTCTPDDIAELEARVDAHVDALVLGGEPALDVTRASAWPDAPWSFYAWVAVACRSGRDERVRDALIELEAFCTDADDDAEAALLRRVVGDAIVHHAPEDRAEAIVGEISGALARAAPVLARCVEARGWVAAGRALRRAEVVPRADLPAVLRAIARLPKVLPDPLLDHVADPDPAVARAAAIGALRRGDTHVLDALLQTPRTAGAALPVAMGSGPSAGAWLATVAIDDDPVQALVALGLLGDPSRIDVLLEHLYIEEHAAAAAAGLYLLTGARLAGSNDDDEREAPVDQRSMEIPRTAAGMSRATGGICTEPEAWAAWIHDHRARLVPGVRHRLGRVAGPLTELAVSFTTSMPRWLRRILADELAIRSGIDWAYDPDMPVACQRAAAAWMTTRLGDHPARFTDGAWYLHGQRVQ